MRKKKLLPVSAEAFLKINFVGISYSWVLWFFRINRIAFLGAGFHWDNSVITGIEF
jgi:hypothetical protein